MPRLARRQVFQCLLSQFAHGWQPADLTGACFTPQGPGQNFELEVYLEGPLDPVSGMVTNLTDVDRVLTQAIERLQAEPIQASTTASLAQNFCERLMPRFSGRARLVKVRLYESTNYWVDVWPE